jgi:phospholipase/carboxylesterase
MGLLFSLLASIGLAQEKQPATDIPDELNQINPLSPSAGDFLTDDLTNYINQAQEYYRNGQYQEAIRYYLYILKRNADDYTSIYNLACCYALLDKPNLAGKYLELAVKAGFTDIAFINNDPDFNKVRDQDAFVSAASNINKYFTERFKARGDMVFFDGCAIFLCHIKLPENYAPAKSYPLVIGLHGYGDNADIFFTLHQRFEKPEFIFAVPYAPYHFLSGGRLAYSWNLWMPGDQEFPGKDFYITENYITNLITQLKHSYNISDVYLLGHSQGGATAFIIGIKHHELIKGIIAMAGPLNPFWINDSTMQAANNLNVLIVHGKKDKVIRFTEGTSAKNILEKHGFNVKLIEFDGDHSYPPEKIMRKIKDWIAGQ